MRSPFSRYPDSAIAANSPSAEFDAAELFREAFKVKVPNRLEVAAEQDVTERVWLPSREDPSQAAVAVARHPAIERIFRHIPTGKMGRSSQSFGRGRQNRFPSLKADRIVHARSSLEMDHFLDCELDSSVTTFCEQPLKLRYRLDGRVLEHQPDALVLCDSGPHELRVIRYERQASTPENERYWQAIGPAVAALGLVYRVRTDQFLRSPIRRSNIKTIFEHRHAPVPSKAVLENIQTQHFSNAARPIRDILNDNPDITLAQVYALIRRQYWFIINLNAPLGPETLLTLGSGLTRWRGGNQFVGQ
jgi:hypothetical protein